MHASAGSTLFLPHPNVELPLIVAVQESIGMRQGPLM